MIEQPTPGPWGAALILASRTAFRYANRWFAVPVHRAGLGAWFGSPIAGCQLLLTTTGRRSGMARHTPLGYIVIDGSAWVLAGYGPSTLWYRNLLVDSNVEVLLPARAPFQGRAESVSEPTVRARVIPPLVRSMAIPGSAIGSYAPTASDERILELTSWVPLVRLTPEGPPLLPGPDDPGGRAWIWRQAVAIWLTVAGARLVRGFIRAATCRQGRG